MMNQACVILDRRVQIEVDDEEPGAVLIDGQSGKIYACNETASVVATHLRRGATVDELALLLARTFEVSTEVARRDTETFLENLTAMRMLCADDTEYDDTCAA